MIGWQPMLSAHALEIDTAAATAKIAEVIRQQVLGESRRKGAVLGFPGAASTARGSGRHARVRSARTAFWDC